MRQQKSTEPAQHAARRHDARRSIGAWFGCECSNRGRAGATGRVRQAKYSRDHGRRCRLVQHRRLSPGHHVRQDAEPRQARRRWHAVHRLLCRSKLHRRPRQFHYRTNPAAHRTHNRGPGRRRCRHAGSVRDNSAHFKVDGLCHGSVREESPRRSEQISADAARLRRILWLFISPRCHVRSVLV